MDLPKSNIRLLDGCERSKLQSLTVQPNLKLFLWTLVFAWTVFRSRPVESGYKSIAFF